MNNSSTGYLIVGEVADHKGHEDGRRVMTSDHDEHRIVHKFFIRESTGAIFTTQVKQMGDEVFTRRDLALGHHSSSLSGDSIEHFSSPLARSQALTEVGEGQVQRHRPHSRQHVLKILNKAFSQGASLQPKYKGAYDVKRETLH